MLFAVTQEMHTWAVGPKQHYTRGGEGGDFIPFQQDGCMWRNWKLQGNVWIVLSRVVAVNLWRKSLCMAMSFTETWPGLVQEVCLCNLGKFWQWSAIFLPGQLCHKNLPRLTHQWACLQAITRPTHVGAGLFYSHLQMAITLGKASNMVLIATKTPLIRNVFDMSLVVGSRELFPEVPEVTPIWYGSFAVRMFFLPRNTWSIWSR